MMHKYSPDKKSRKCDELQHTKFTARHYYNLQHPTIPHLSRHGRPPHQIVHHHGPSPSVSTVGPSLGIYVSWPSRPHPHNHPKSGYGWHPPPHCVGTYSWMEGNNGAIPHTAVKVGIDKDGSPIYAGRAFHEGDLLPAKVAPSHGGAFVAWGGREHSKFEYEVLCSTHVGWTSASEGEVPPEAICIGQTQNGEKLYMGRVMHDGTLTPGKIQPSHGCLYIPYAGVEMSFREYEVMVLM